MFWIIAILAIVLDQVIKAWARHTFADNLAVLHSAPFPGVFEFTLTYNEGIAFGMFQGHGVLLAPVAILMSVGSVWYSVRHPHDPALAHVAMGLLAAGALGNLYDRLAFGKVTDMFYFRAINFPVFNVADSCITIAAGLLIYLWSVEAMVKPKPAPPPPPQAEQA
ncbi:MAG: signal peptidase II [Fimbriimonadaceae bacterium]